MKLRLPFILASRFVAGRTLDDALPVVDRHVGKGMHVALDLLGESITDRCVAEKALESYLTLIRMLAGRRAPGAIRHQLKVSIKLSMLGQMIDEGFCLANLRRLLDTAVEHDMFVRLDMEGSETTDSTLRLFDQVHRDYRGYVGPVLQAMLKRTERDIEHMCTIGAGVRLCKGAYKEPPDVACQDMGEIRERYIRYMEVLLRAGHYPGIATHDDALIQATRVFAAANGIDHDAYELQMLYGLRPSTQERLAGEGHDVLVYLPYGTEWFPYYYRRLRERKENVWFLVNTLLRR